MQNPPAAGINLDGYSARSVIIALHGLLSTLQKPFWIFNFCFTKIKLTCEDNHGRLKLQIGDAQNSDNCLVSGIPYTTAMTDYLREIEAQLGINLMAEIVRRFSKAILPFRRHSFAIVLTQAQVNFLNGFSFLSQICEVARYLDCGGADRSIVKKPMSLALAVTKHLRIANRGSWEYLYSKIPLNHAFAQAQQVKTYNVPGYDPQKDALRGLDPASGANLKNNIPTLQNKIEKLSELYPNHLSNIPSARGMHGFQPSSS
jgi:hypothetical protein